MFKYFGYINMVGVLGQVVGVGDWVFDLFDHYLLNCPSTIYLQLNTSVTLTKQRLSHKQPDLSAQLRILNHLNHEFT